MAAEACLCSKICVRHIRCVNCSVLASPLSGLRVGRPSSLFLPWEQHKQTNKTCMLERINDRLNSGNTCCHSVQNLLSYRSLSNDTKIEINIKIVVLYGCETWFVPGC